MAQLVKNLPAMQETWVQSLGGKVPWRQGRSPGDRKGYPLQYSGLKNSMDCIVHGVAKSRTQLSNFHSLSLKEGEGNGTPLQYSCLENPWPEEPGRLQSMGSLRVRHDWATSLSLFTFMHWRRKWQPTPVFLPGESQGRGSLMGCRLWGHTESGTTEGT